MLKGKGDSANRKPRLFVDSNDATANAEGNDPIAAALAARTRKQEQALKAAAAAAAKAAAANVITYFADDSPAKPKHEQNTGSAVPTAGDVELQSPLNGLFEHLVLPTGESSPPADHAAPSHLHAEAQDGGNPLASLLGYSGDDGSGSEAGDETPEREAPDGQSEQRPASDDNDSTIDAELANFMEELESSGLLKETSTMDEHDGHDRQPSDSAGLSPTILAAISTPMDPSYSSPPAAAAAASTQHDRKVEGHEASSLGVSQSTSQAQDGEAAEQCVLGSLTGCPGWHEVMDMASGKVYFWDEATDEVAWDPPAGSQPRTDGENKAVFAAAHASPEATPADPDSESAPAERKQALAPSAVEVPSGLEESSLDPAEAGREAQKAEREDGELEARPADITLPDEAIERAARDLLAQSWAAAEQLCGSAPLLVRLAVEAEVRLRDWQALAAAQRQAAESDSAAGALSWDSYQRAVRAELELLQGALPGALQEAHAASTSAAAAVTAAAQQAEEAAREDGEVSADADAQANPPPMPEGLQPAPADDTSVDMDTTDDVATTQASASASMLSTSQPLSAATSAPVPAQIPSTTHPLSAPPPQARPAAADTLTAQINSRMAAAAAAVQPAGSGTSSMPSASAALPRPIAPFLAPLPASAPHWPGYYQPAPPYAFPHMPYPYMPYPLPYVGPQIQQPASAPLPASTPHQAAPVEDASVPDRAPPLPQEEQPPLPSSAPEATPPAASAAAPAKRKEYRAEPVRAAMPPAPAEPPDQPPAAATAAAPDEDSKKRKLRRGALASAKRRASVKVGSLAPSVLDKWAAARKDLEEKEEGQEGADAEAAERRRMREAEEWRLKQLRSGVSSQANSNFQPLAMDWREKIKAAKGRPADAPKATAVKAEPKKYTSKPDLDALSGGLPPGWKALWDKQSGEVYYGNPTTKETSWEKPE